MEVVPTLWEFRAAERRLRESLWIRELVPFHTYPQREEDMFTISRFTDTYGLPPLSLPSQLVWWLRLHVGGRG